jgi:hypothetical protein
MDWSNEEYVRVYTRNTTTWRLLGWDGQCVLMQLLRRMDRAGVLDIEDLEPWEAVVLHCGAPEQQAVAGIAECLRRKCIVHSGRQLMAPRFIEAQTASKSDKLRAKESRDRRHASASQNVTPPSRNEPDTVTESDAGVTVGHTASQPVTPRHAASLSALLCGASLTDAMRCDAAPAPISDLEPGEPEPATPLPEQIRRSYRRRFHDALKSYPAEANGKAVAKLANWCADNADNHNTLPEALAERVLDGLFRSPTASDKHFPLAYAAHDPLEYLGAPRAAKGAPRPPSRVEDFVDSDHPFSETPT